MTPADKNTKNLLVLIDPSSETHFALERAITQHDVNERKVIIHLFVCVEVESLYGSSSKFQINRDEQWLDNITSSLKARNIEYTMDLCWSVDWQESIINCAKKYNAERIVISDYSSNAGETSLTASKRSLLRTAPCPVLIIHPNSAKKRKIVLAAINMQTINPHYIALNKKLLEVCWDMQKTYNSDIHIVNAYSDSGDYPDRGAILRKANIAQENLHIEEGHPEKIISKVAEKLDADIVVIGTLARKGLVASFKGNKSEAIIKQLKCDILVLN